MEEKSECLKEPCMKNQFSLPYEAGEIHLFKDSLVLYVVNKSLR